MSSLDPIAKNDVWATMAALARRLRALESVGGGSAFQTGDILHSLKTHPDMLTTTLSDGGRPGWWLLNGATDPNMQTTDPVLFEMLGGNVLEDARGRVLAAPKSGGAFAAGAEIGAETGPVSVSGTTGAEAGHTHGVSLPTSVGQSGSGFTATQTSSVITGAGSAHSHSFSGSGSADTIQPTLVVGSVWIKR